MSLAALFRRPKSREVAEALYASIVDQARQPAFFSRFGVPDTLDGRFELIALHGFLVLNRLKAAHSQTAELSQLLFDVMFVDIDYGLREMGVGDLSVGRHVKTMAKAFYGRIVSYERGLTDGDAELEEALRRNLYGTVDSAPGDRAIVAFYLRQAAASLATQAIEEIASGRISFPSLPDRADAPPADMDGRRSSGDSGKI